jgi:hypothetical protein
MNNKYPDTEIRIKINDPKLYDQLINKKDNHTPFIIHTDKALYYVNEISLLDTELYEVNIDILSN